MPGQLSVKDFQEGPLGASLPPLLAAGWGQISGHTSQFRLVTADRPQARHPPLQVCVLTEVHLNVSILESCFEELEIRFVKAPTWHIRINMNPKNIGFMPS